MTNEYCDGRSYDTVLSYCNYTHTDETYHQKIYSSFQSEGLLHNKVSLIFLFGLVTYWYHP